VHHLHGGVHASVGATGRVNFNLVIGDLREPFLNDGLNTARVALRLPTGKATTVVFKAESDAHEGSE
jgi:hypothetical protein